MVKRDSKERSVSKTGSNFEEDDDDDDDDDEGVEESYVGEEPPPPPLPRGNYQNLHDFLKTPNDGSQQQQQQQNFGSLPRTTSGRIRYTDPDEDDDAGEDPRNGSSSNGLNGKSTSTLPKTNFKLGEYYKRKYSKVQPEMHFKITPDIPIFSN